MLSLTGKAIGVSTYTYDTASGIATVGTSTYHGLSVNNKVTVAISTVGVRTDGDTGSTLEVTAAPFLGSFTVTKDKVTGPEGKEREVELVDGVRRKLAAYDHIPDGVTLTVTYSG